MTLFSMEFHYLAILVVPPVTLHIWSILRLRSRYRELTETVPAFVNFPEFSLAKAVFNPWYLHGLGRHIVDVIDPFDASNLPVPE
jgi:hypothetical protein